MLRKKHNTVSLFDITTVEGFERVYRKYYGKMHNIAYLKTGSYEVAESLAQDILCKLWEKREEIIIQGSLENYLMKALRNRILNHFRNLEVQRRHTAQKAKETEISESTTEKEVDLRELQERVGKLVDQLPEKSKKIYRLSREKGMTGREISKLLLIPERTISTHLSNALSFLRKGLGNDYGSLL